MGTTGPLGGADITGAISSGVLTVSAITTGNTIEVGMRVGDPANVSLRGTITGQLTGTAGGTGTYSLSGATDTTSRNLKVVGDFFQLDGLHINGAGAVGPDVGGKSCAGKYVSDSFKAFLPSMA